MYNHNKAKTVCIFLGIYCIPRPIQTNASLPWPLTHDLEKSTNLGYYHLQFVFQIWEQLIQCLLSYLAHIIYTAEDGWLVMNNGLLWHETIIFPHPSNMEYLITTIDFQEYCIIFFFCFSRNILVSRNNRHSWSPAHFYGCIPGNDFHTWYY